MSVQIFQPLPEVSTPLHRRLLAPLRLWAQGRPWYLYLPLWVGMLWFFGRYVTTPGYFGFIDWLGLVIHEMGHLLFFWLGDTFFLIGGTFWQLTVPGLLIGYFWRKGDWFAVCFALYWLSTNLFSVATYAADARAQELQLISYAAGGEIGHDWFQMLSAVGWLEFDVFIGSLIRGLGLLLGALSLLCGGALLWWMRPGSRH